MFAFLHAVWFRLSSRWRRASLEHDLVRELALHAELLREEAEHKGATPDEARREAAYRLGNISSIRERTRQQWSWGLLDALMQDTKYAARFLRRSPGFTAVAVLSLALGVGANAVVFSVADRLMFSEPPQVKDAGGLYLVNVTRNTGTDEFTMQDYTQFPEFLLLREQARSYASISLYVTPQRVRMGEGPEAPRIRESRVSIDFFGALGVQPVRGRLFVPDDHVDNRSDRAAIISYDFWKRHFDGADSAVGARFTTSRMTFVVVGIMPRGFTGIDLDAADVWVPLEAVAATRMDPKWRTRGGAFTAHTVVRLRAGVTPEQGAAEATVIVNRVPPERSMMAYKKVAVLGSLIQGRGPAVKSNEVKVATRLIAASVIVLFAACANLSNLLLVRALTRKREIALRLAIGVSGPRLVAQMLIESAMIAMLGASVALLVAHWGGAALRTLVFPGIQWGDTTANVRVILYAVITGTAVSAIATAVPAVRMTRADVGTALRSAASQLTMSTGRWRQGLLALQVALSAVLIVGAMAFGRSLNDAYNFDMGMDVDRIVSVRYTIDGDSVSSASRAASLHEAARRLRLIAGVERASVANAIPLLANTNSQLQIPERELPPDSYAVKWDITPELQKTMGFRLLRGRWVDDADVVVGVPPVVLASETMARTLWPNDDALKHCVVLGKKDGCRRVVGVIKDLRAYSIRDEAPLSVLTGTGALQIDDRYAGYVIVRARANVELASLVPPIRRALRNLRPDLVALEVQPLAQMLDKDFRPLKLGAATFGSFALLAVVLAAVGLYGVLAFNVAQRTGEFGIRSALGARASHLVKSVVGEGVAIVMSGLTVGVGLSWYASSAIATLLFQSSAHDLQPYASAIAVLGMVALAASAVPAWRVTRIDPATALRAE